MGSISVIGGGSWGTTLANLLAEKGFDVSLWIREQEIVDEMLRTGMNGIYMPGIPLSPNIRPTNDLETALRDSKYVINAVPTQFCRSVFKEAQRFINKDAVIVSVSKGIEHDTLLTCSAILKEITGKRVAVLSGPSFAEEVIKKIPTAVTIASEDREVSLMLQELFYTEYFRVYTHTDVLGVELGGALKNVMAIAAGISDGLGLGASTRAALITRGLAEMKRLGVAMGAREDTFGGLSGLGDLVLTCTSTLSRNYTVGYRLGRGESLDSILSHMHMVAEGVPTSKSAYELSRRYNVEMPITEQIYKVVNEGKDPKLAVHELMTRSLKPEF